MVYASLSLSHKNATGFGLASALPPVPGVHRGHRLCLQERDDFELTKGGQVLTRQGRNQGWPSQATDQGMEARPRSVLSMRRDPEWQA